MRILLIATLLLAGCAADPCKMAANYQAPQHIDKPFQAAQARQHDMAVRECSAN